MEPSASDKQGLKEEIRRDKAIASRLLIPFHQFHKWRDSLPAEYYEALVDVLLEDQSGASD